MLKDINDNQAASASKSNVNYLLKVQGRRTHGEEAASAKQEKCLGWRPRQLPEEQYRIQSMSGHKEHFLGKCLN